MTEVHFLGVGRRSEVDPAAVEALAAQLFPAGEMLAGEDLIAWYARLTDRIALIEAVLDVARTRRAQVVAHLHDSFGRSYADIAASATGGLSATRASQLAARGRPHIKPLNPKDYGTVEQPALWP